jgi:uncharacterized protein (DUF486 family)
LLFDVIGAGVGATVGGQVGMTVGWTVFMTVGWTVLQLLVLPVFLVDFFAFLEGLPTNRVGGHVGAGDTVGVGVLAFLEDFLFVLLLGCLAFFNMRVSSSLHAISDGSSPLLR